MPDVPCYKQKEYGDWCQGEETLRAENTGYYCIFHLPKGVNEKGSAVLKTRVFQRINDAKVSGKACNLSGTVFNDDISFSQFNKDGPMPEVDFSYAVFHGQADFRGVVFEGMTSFGWATVEKDAYFNSAFFKKGRIFLCGL